jgi:hypothetical protein
MNKKHIEGIEIIFPKQKIIEAKQLDPTLYKPLHQAIIDSQFWNEDNTPGNSDYSKILQTNVDQTEAAETLTADLNFFFMQNKIPVTVAVHSPDPHIKDNAKTIINPGHPNYPNGLVIGGDQGVVGKDSKRYGSKFLMNLFLGTYGDNFSINDIDPKLLAQNIGKLIRHEIIHLYQIEARRKHQRISRMSTLEKYKDEKEIPAKDDPRDVYLSSKIEIDAYAHEFAEELLRDHGEEKALAIIRGDIDLNDVKQSEQFHEFFSSDRPTALTRRLRRKIYGHIMHLADLEVYK